MRTHTPTIMCIHTHPRTGLRYVLPYAYTFTSFAKGRWLNRELLEVLCSEFRAETREYYVCAPMLWRMRSISVSTVLDSR